MKEPSKNERMGFEQRKSLSGSKPESPDSPEPNSKWLV